MSAPELVTVAQGKIGTVFQCKNLSIAETVEVEDARVRWGVIDALSSPSTCLRSIFKAQAKLSPYPVGSCSSSAAARPAAMHVATDQLTTEYGVTELYSLIQMSLLVSR